MVKCLIGASLAQCTVHIVCALIMIYMYNNMCEYDLHNITQVVQSGNKNIELAIIEKGKPLKVCNK